MLEKDIEAKVCDYARKHGMIAYKFTSPQRRNVPDRLFIAHSGVTFFIEFKAPKKKPTPAQLREHQRLLDRGHIVHVCDDVEKGKCIIDEILAAT